MIEGVQPLAAAYCMGIRHPLSSSRSGEDAAREDLVLKTPSAPGSLGAMVVGTSPLYSCSARPR